MPNGIGRRGWALALALALTPLSTFAQTEARPANEAIGSWILSCPAAPQEPCVLRHRDWLLAPSKGGLGAALEVQMRGDSVVPVITVRGLPASAAFGGSIAVRPLVTLGFDGGKRAELVCGPGGASYACAPAPEAVPAIAALLPKARVAAASVSVTVPGMAALPPQDRSMELAGTELAISRLRAGGAIKEALPAFPGLDLQGFLDKLLRDLGFPHGMGDTMPTLIPMLNWLRSQ